MLLEVLVYWLDGDRGVFLINQCVASSLKWKYLGVCVCCFPFIQIPSDLLDKEFLPILQEEPLPPLALVPFTEEEQVGIPFPKNKSFTLSLVLVSLH